MLLEIRSILSTNFVNYMWITMFITPLNLETMEPKAHCLFFVQLVRHRGIAGLRYANPTYSPSQ